MRRLWTASIPASLASVVIAVPEKARNFLGDMEPKRSGEGGRRRNRGEERDLKRIKERLNKEEEEEEEADIDVLLHVVVTDALPCFLRFVLFYFMSTTLTMYLSALYNKPLPTKADKIN